MEKLLFVNPSSKNVGLAYVPPLVLGVLASYIMKIHPQVKVKIVDEILGQPLS